MAGSTLPSAPDDVRGRLHLLAGPDAAGGGRTAVINQDARLYAAEVRSGDRIAHALREGRHAWIQVVRGTVVVNNTELRQGDGVAVSDEPAVLVTGDGEFLLFDLP